MTRFFLLLFTWCIASLPVSAANKEQPRFSRQRFCAEQTSFQGDRILCLIKKGPDFRVHTLQAMVKACHAADGSESDYRACIDAEIAALSRAYRFLFPVAESLANSLQEYDDLHHWHHTASKEQQEKCARAQQEAIQENGGIRAPFTNSTRNACTRTDWIERLHILLQTIPSSVTKKNPAFYPRRTQPEEEMLFDSVVACTGDTANPRANGDCLMSRAELMEHAKEHLQYLLAAENIEAPAQRSECPSSSELSHDSAGNQRCRLRLLRQQIQVYLNLLMPVLR